MSKDKANSSQNNQPPKQQDNKSTPKPTAPQNNSVFERADLDMSGYGGPVPPKKD